MSYVVGVDLGGTWMRVGIVDPSNGTPDLAIEVHRDPSPRSWDALVDLLKPHATADIAGFGVAVSGPVQDHAVLVTGPNLPWLSGRNIRRDLESALGKTVVVSNDMEAATAGEMACGILRSYDWAIFDTISTGWGGNLILDGKRVDGEPGHASTGRRVRQKCGAGHVGCFEALYSGSALERRIRDRIHEMNAKEVDSWAYFQKEVDQASEWASALLEDWAEGVGRAWANTLNCIRPLQAIVYMGTTAENLLSLPQVQKTLRETIQSIVMFPEHRRPDFPIQQATFEHRSLYGAAIIYEQHA